MSGITDEPLDDSSRGFMVPRASEIAVVRNISTARLADLGMWQGEASRQILPFHPIVEEVS